MSRDDVRLRTADEVDPAALHAFLERSFGTVKAGFLDRHGSWWHDGPENRLVLESGGTIAGYCGVIPVRVVVGGAVRDGLWWLDLVVAPESRGRGLQTILDAEVRRRSDLLLGFPNKLAAKIHRKHGWGVREDLRVVMAPLRPAELGAVRRARGGQGAALRAAARVLSPAAALWRRRLCGYSPVGARRADEPDLERWTSLAGAGSEDLATTLRDEAWLRRRYLEAPYRGELLFYESGPLVMVGRRLVREGHVEERVLDVFGDLRNREALADLLRLCLREAASSGATQVIALAGPPELAQAFQRSGFRLGSVGRFCWSSPERRVMEALGRARPHWTLGDSDNDEPA